MPDFLTDSLSGRLLFAIPKKGRLYEKCLELLAGADIQFTRSHRLDVCLVRNHNMALVFLPAADIPRFVGEGNIDLGITGQDMVAEAGLGDLISEALPLGFGKCKLQVQVPERGKVSNIKDLVGLRVATSFENVSKEYFTKMDVEHGAKQSTKIEYIGGSVEAACALGLADGIVDLVESGETMRAAGLHPIETILQSEAVLIRSSRTSADQHVPLIERVTSRIAGVIAAKKYVLCNYNVARASITEAVKITPGRTAPTISPLDNGNWVAVASMVSRSEVADVMDRLQVIGASDILIIELSNCRV